jgi:hypothetical protein
MRRRSYLAGVTALAASLAGCGGGDTETTDDETDDGPGDDSADSAPTDETTTDEGSADDDSPSAAPSVAFSFEYAVGDSGSGDLTITHTSGDHVRAGSLVLRGEFDAASGGTWLDYEGSASGDLGDDPAVVAGDSVTVSAGSAYEISVVWEGEDTSATLSTDEGPDA